MAKPEVTKQIISNSFKTLLKKSDYHKITNRDIITTSGFSNKTYYYHFRDKEDLTAWIFHDEVEEVLLKVVDMEYFNLLEKQMIKKEKHFQKPFYIMLCKETDKYFSRFWELFMDYLFENREFYKKTLSYEGQNNLKTYVIQLYHQQFKDNLMLLIYNKEFKVKISPLEVDILAEYLTNAFIGTLFYWIQNDDFRDYRTNFISTNLTCITQRCIDFLDPSLSMETQNS